MKYNPNENYFQTKGENYGQNEINSEKLRQVC